ncbi:Rieske (2Fe-2S) protein [Microbacterium allomyrinae]|uniref:Rieske 2Fe-2S domain-containing protein n=1 Tax=Microbacterium allomyrinae TaxID=2830666 RepID=A0A9X1S4R0_9MICO|nr:Rieske 2Fe-2S domain-containing protein [Microbacterium allomyrinae]MCC2033255.1 Rieske 2Fe-2S domain-containing protein [Microbacterium allomyrinae]
MVHAAASELRVHVGPVSAFLEEDERTVVKVGDREVLVLAVRGRLFAIGNRCTHLPAQLRRGHVLPESFEINCPVHMGRYSLMTGEATELPCETPLPKYAVEVVDGELYVFVPDTPLDPPRADLQSHAAGSGRPAGLHTNKEAK